MKVTRGGPWAACAGTGNMAMCLPSGVRRRSERRFVKGTFQTRSVVLAGRIDESLHDRILEIRVH